MSSVLTDLLKGKSTIAEAVTAKMALENPANQLKYVKNESKILTSRKGTSHSSGNNEQNKLLIVIM